MLSVFYRLYTAHTFAAAKVQQIFVMCKILTEKNRLCSHKGGFSVKRLSLARKCERTFEGSRPEGEGEEVESNTFLNCAV